MKIGPNLNFEIWGIFSKTEQNHDKSADNSNISNEIVNEGDQGIGCGAPWPC
jgi:hypothetical protein